MKDPELILPFELSRRGILTTAETSIFHHSWMTADELHKWLWRRQAINAKNDNERFNFMEFSRLRTHYEEMVKSDKFFFLFHHINVMNVIFVEEGSWVTDDRKELEEILLKPYRGERLCREMNLV